MVESRDRRVSMKERRSNSALAVPSGTAKKGYSPPKPKTPLAYEWV